MLFQSSTLESGELTSFEEYASRMSEEQKDIYYVVAASREVLETLFEVVKIAVLWLLECFLVCIWRHARWGVFSHASVCPSMLWDALGSTPITVLGANEQARSRGVVATGPCLRIGHAPH
jgi:hypothetical protein